MVAALRSGRIDGTSDATEKSTDQTDENNAEALNDDASKDAQPTERRICIEWNKPMLIVKSVYLDQGNAIRAPPQPPDDDIIKLEVNNIVDPPRPFSKRKSIDLLSTPNGSRASSPIKRRKFSPHRSLRDEIDEPADALRASAKRKILDLSSQAVASRSSSPSKRRKLSRQTTPKETRAGKAEDADDLAEKVSIQLKEEVNESIPKELKSPAHREPSPATTVQDSDRGQAVVLHHYEETNKREQNGEQTMSSGEKQAADSQPAEMHDAVSKPLEPDSKVGSVGPSAASQPGGPENYDDEEEAGVRDGEEVGEDDELLGEEDEKHEQEDEDEGEGEGEGEGEEEEEEAEEEAEEPLNEEEEDEESSAFAKAKPLEEPKINEDPDVLEASDLPPPFLPRPTAPLSSSAFVDPAAELLSKLYEPLPSYSHFVNALTAHPPSKRSTETLVALALNTQSALKAWQDEYIVIDRRTAPASTQVGRKLATGGRIPMDPKAWDAMKEDELLSKIGLSFNGNGRRGSGPRAGERRELRRRRADASIIGQLVASEDDGGDDERTKRRERKPVRRFEIGVNDSTGRGRRGRRRGGRVATLSRRTGNIDDDVASNTGGEEDELFSGTATPGTMDDAAPNEDVTSRDSRGTTSTPTPQVKRSRQHPKPKSEKRSESMTLWWAERKRKAAEQKVKELKEKGLLDQDATTETAMAAAAAATAAGKRGNTALAVKAATAAAVKAAIAAAPKAVVSPKVAATTAISQATKDAPATNRQRRNHSPSHTNTEEQADSREAGSLAQPSSAKPVIADTPKVPPASSLGSSANPTNVLSNTHETKSPTKHSSTYQVSQPSQTQTQSQYQHQQHQYLSQAPPPPPPPSSTSSSLPVSSSQQSDSSYVATSQHQNSHLPPMSPFHRSVPLPMTDWQGRYQGPAPMQPHPHSAPPHGYPPRQGGHVSHGPYGPGAHAPPPPPPPPPPAYLSHPQPPPPLKASPYPHPPPPLTTQHYASPSAAHPPLAGQGHQTAHQPFHASPKGGGTFSKWSTRVGISPPPPPAPGSSGSTATRDGPKGGSGSSSSTNTKDSAGGASVPFLPPTMPTTTNLAPHQYKHQTHQVRGSWL